MDYYVNVLKKFAVFGGRARRKEFWTFALFNNIVCLVLILFLWLVVYVNPLSLFFFFLWFSLATSLSITVRRLHDLGLSGGLVLIGLIPFIGIIALLILCCLDSQPEDNEYGPNPKGINTVFAPDTDSDAPNPQEFGATPTPNIDSKAAVINYYLDPWKKYAVFQGRTRRKEFWLFALFNGIILWALTFIRSLGIPILSELFYFIVILYDLAVFLPNVGLTIRRLHDTGKSGWWALPYYLIPGINSIFNLAAPILFHSLDPKQIATALEQSSLFPLYTDYLMSLSLIYLPYIIVMLVFFCLDSQPGENKYGPYPKPEVLSPEDAIKNEFVLIPALPNTMEVMYNPGNVDLNFIDLKSYYTTDHSYQEIGAYYDSQLTNHNWTYVETEDLGAENEAESQSEIGKIILYTKGNLTARLAYIGKQADPKGTYAFSISNFKPDKYNIDWLLNPVSYPENSLVKEALLKEFNLIPPMPGAIYNDTDFIEEDVLISIDRSYVTEHSYEEIKAYYDDQLKKRDWQFYGEEKEDDLGHDYGSKSIHYKKGDFSATIKYSGATANYSWTYTFNMGWWSLEDAMKKEEFFHGNYAFSLFNTRPLDDLGALLATTDKLPPQERYILKNLCLLPAQMYLRSDLKTWLELNNDNALNNLIAQGWLIEEGYSVQMMQAIKETVQHQLKPKIIDIAYLINNLENMLDQLSNANDHSQLQEKINLLNEIVPYWIANNIGPGEDYPDTLTSMGNLAIIYSDLGRHEEALHLEEQVLAKRLAIWGEDHPDTLTAMSNLAVTYNDLGRHEEALHLEKQVLAKRRALLGDDHPDTLTSISNLADTYRNLGRRNEASALQEELKQHKKL